MQVQKQPLFVPVMVRDVSPLLAGAIEPRRCLVDSVVAVADRVLVEVFRLVVYSVFKLKFKYDC